MSANYPNCIDFKPRVRDSTDFPRITQLEGEIQNLDLRFKVVQDYHIRLYRLCSAHCVYVNGAL